MQFKNCFWCPIITLIVCSGVHAQPAWTGIIAPTRAIDWSHAGIAGGVPSGTWTQCGATIAAYGTTSAHASPSTINSAIAACGTNQFVLLGTGDFYLSGGVDFAHKSNVVLRGAGADQTRLHFSAAAGCNGWGAGVCLAGSNTYNAGGYNSANWTAGYSQGTTQITLSSVTGITLNLTPIILDQCNTGLSGSSCTGSQTDNNQWFVCDAGSNCISQTATTGVYRTLRGQEEVVVATAISGSGPYTLTISPSIRSSNWSSGQAPQAWWGTTVIANSGVENLLVDVSGAGGIRGITMMMSNGTWVKGVAVQDANYQHVFNYLSVHNVVRDSYFFLSYNTAQQSYGIGCSVSADALIENNIFQQVTDPVSLDASCPGGVAAYNFAVNNPFTPSLTYLFPFIQMHSAGSAFFLTEGNIGSQALEDDIHGTHQADTYFRNYFNGFQPDNGTQTSSNDSAIGFSAFSRYMNAIGNVLGSTAWHKVYQYDAISSSGSACGGGTCKDVLDIGYSGNTLGQQGAAPDDPRVGQTLFRWGNYDVVTGAARWCGTGSETNCGGTSEVPTGDSYYPNSIPASQTLPASFYLSSKPSWMPSGTSWPVIGPDVSTGAISMCTSGTYLNSLVLNGSQCAGGTSSAVMAGHAVANPAMQCYLNNMSGLPNGTGSMLAFNANSCYSQSSNTLNPPATSAAIVH